MSWSVLHAAHQGRYCSLHATEHDCGAPLLLPSPQRLAVKNTFTTLLVLHGGGGSGAEGGGGGGGGSIAAHPTAGSEPPGKPAITK